MTLPMWLTLVASLGQTLLIALVVRARHALALPLAALMVDLLVWNLAWLGYACSGSVAWRWLSMSVATLISPLGFECVLAFVGRARSESMLRHASWLYFGALSLSSASRFVWQGEAPFVGRAAWRAACVVGIVALAIVSLKLLFEHHRRHPSRDERSYTRIVLVGGLCGLAVGTTDLIHDHVTSVPQLSNIGTLVCALGMAAVVLRSRLSATGFPLRLALFSLGSAAVAVAVLNLLFRAVSPGTGMMVVRTVLLCFVVLAIIREVVTSIAARRARLAELALLGRMSAQLAHDLKNPLSALKGALQFFDEPRRRGELRGETGELLDLMAAQAARLERIVEHYARAARVQPSLEPVDVTAVLASVVPPMVRAGSVALSWRLDPALPRCMADRDLLARAIENVVQNALEAMPVGGDLTVGAQQDGGDLVLSLRDSGHGIDARTAERAFDDFFTTKVSGSGLGLAFVRRVAEAHGGSASLASRPGRGTTVTFRLPALTESVRFSLMEEPCSPQLLEPS